jgi:hypothetical protein
MDMRTSSVGATTHARAERGERGATLVEMAIVLPLLLLLVFGIIEFGIAWFENQSISQGVREAARRGVVLDFDGDVSACTGFGSSEGDEIACQAGHVIGVDGAYVRVSPEGTSAEPQLTVCAAVEYDALTGYLNPFLDGRVLKSSTTLPMEQQLTTEDLDGTWGDDDDDEIAACA